MSQDIIPLTIDNLSSPNQTIEFSVSNAYNLVDRPGDYKVVIDKITLPIMNVPIAMNEKFNIWFDSLDKENHPPAIVGGDMKKIPFYGTFYDMNDFCEKLSDFFTNVLGTYNFLSFSYDSGTQLINYHETVENKKFIRVFIDQRLRDVLANSGVRKESELISGEQFWHIDGSKNFDHTYPQYEPTLEILCTLQKFKIYTDLPVSPNYSFDMNTSSLIVGKCLSDIDFNPQSMIGNKTIKYLPTVLREFSLLDGSPINNFRIYFRAYYANGMEENIKTDTYSYCSINLRFIKKVFIIKDNASKI